jgi:hypothetical protein
MKREFLTGLRVGTFALAIAALATPALAQGQGGVKPDSTAENPSTKAGTPAQKRMDTKGTNTGSMQRATPRAGTSSGSEAGSGGGSAKGQGSSSGQPTSDPRANPNTPVSPTR